METGVGLSGRKVTPVIVLVLLGICFAVAYFVTVVHQLQQKRDATAESWRQSVVLLDRDYQRIAQLMSESSEQDADGSLKEFRQHVDEFRTTVDLAKQRTSADTIEQYLSKSGTHLTFDISPPQNLCESVNVYNQRLGEEREILTSFGGRLVRVFLVVPELTDFQIAR